MKVVNVNPQNYINTFQVMLPLDVGVLIYPDDPLITFKEITKEVNLRKYLVSKDKDSRGRKGYDPYVLLEIVLFAFMINVRSLRDIEKRCQYDIRFMYISNNSVPTHMTLCNFINEYLLDSIDDINKEITKYLVKKLNTDTSVVYIDGTKIEAFPNRYTWVWKNACLTSIKRTFGHISDLYSEINKEFIFGSEINLNIQKEYEIEELETNLKNILAAAVNSEITFVKGKGKRKSKIQRFYERLNGYICKLKDYSTKINICGDHRNSYSKTDHDATFMRMKTDYMGNTALLPAYNWQIAVADELIVTTLVSQSPNDARCFIDILNRYKEIFDKYPDKPVADAGYGNLDNYRFCKENDIKLFMKFSTWKRETHDKSFHEDIFRAVNFRKDDDGNLICPNDKKFIKYREVVVPNNKDKRTAEKYICENCSGCTLKSRCFNHEGNRVINLNEELSSYHKEVIDNLSTEEGIFLRTQRSIQAEGAFGVIKQDYSYRRITRVSKKKVNLELSLIAIGFNLKKYHNIKLRKKPINTEDFFDII